MLDRGIGSWLRRRERMSPGQVAAIAGDTVRTYREMAVRSYRMADVLRRSGVERGDRVAFLGRNSPEFLEMLVATTSLGAIFVPLNWRLTLSELTFILGDAGAGLLVHDGSMGDQLRNLVSDSGVGRAVSLGTELEDLLSGADESWVDLPVDLDDPALIIYTSGTTGRPKGAVLSHANVTWNCVNVMIDMAPTSEEVALVGAPMFHVAALNMLAMPTLLAGGTNVLMSAFDPGLALDLIQRHRVTVMFGVPAMYNAISQHPGWSEADLTSLRRVFCGGAPVPRSVIDTWLDRDVTFLQGYGMTETSPGALFLGPRDAREKAGSAGLPSFFTDVELRHPDGRPVAPGERGEIVVSGPNVMLGYWGQTEATEEVLVDGWFHSGDVGVVDEDGYVTVVDRLKDMYISGGENVYPAEVEDALMSHEAVADCAVIGVPDARWGETGRAYVVTTVGSDVDEEDLVRHLRDRLAGYKVPTSFVFVEELPRSGAGKVLKHRLREGDPEARVGPDGDVAPGR